MSLNIYTLLFHLLNTTTGSKIINEVNYQRQQNVHEIMHYQKFEDAKEVIRRDNTVAKRQRTNN